VGRQVPGLARSDGLRGVGFEASPLYGGAGTYVYAAPILVEGRAVGGVALVFDSTPQFEAMLRAALPEAAGSVAAFCRPDGAVISRTGELPVTLPAFVLALGPGQSWSSVADRGRPMLRRRRHRRQRLPRVQDQRRLRRARDRVVVTACGQPFARRVVNAPQIANVGDGIEIATFLIGEHLLGVLAGDVVECIEVAAAVRVWRGGFAQRHVGFVTWNDMALPLVDIAADVNAPGAAHRHALVLRAGQQTFGLLVSELARWPT